ncbi:hypothetical protein NL676_023164 [Syzygium grande]|nr:hypothetical protein NL676_023164 [Syzygium grande]
MEDRIWHRWQEQGIVGKSNGLLVGAVAPIKEVEHQKIEDRITGKSNGSLRRGNAWEMDFVSSRKISLSDYDKDQYVAEPGIDKKAMAVIAKFH